MFTTVSSGQTVTGFVGDLTVLSGGTAISAFSGLENVFGTDFNATIGVQNVFGGGSAIDTTINDGGFQGTEVVWSGGVAIGTTLIGGGFVSDVVVFSDGVTSDATLTGSTGVANEFVLPGGSAVDTTVNHMAVLEVESSGVSGFWGGPGFGSAISTTVNSGGFALANGGILIATTVNNGGSELVFNGGATTDTIVNAGGVEVVYSASLDVAATVGGTQIVLSGGTASGADITAGGFELVESGGTTLGALIDGGVLEVQGGGSTGDLPVSFTKNGGDLQLDFSQFFTGTIAGFASPAAVTEEIDLRDIGFDATTKLSFVEAAGGTSGTLTVTDGTNTANLTLLGQYSTANFSLASDGNGGTIITDPPATVGSAASPILAAHHT
jgi:autotransporter passenger strand-loop-strand repeat protein